jgi:predicted nucleic acid-binding Zn ribbon protein
MRRKDNYPKNHADKRDEADMMGDVYAGPDFFANQSPQMFQAVYGGPDFFTQRDNPAFIPAGAPGQAPDPNAQAADLTPRKRCTNCGAQIVAEAKFCSECGTPQPKDTQPHTYCCECGTQIPAGARFCSTCGAPQPGGNA